MTTLARVGERAFIDAIARLAGRGRGAGVRVGIGDDAAVVCASPSTILTTDAMIEGVHFRRSWLGAAALGRRAFRVAVSDVAAMGGRARFVLVALALPASYELAEARALVAGLVADAERVGACVVGGNVSRAPAISITVTVVGETTAPPLRRDAARTGHLVFVTGNVGGASAGVELLRAGHGRGALVDAYRRPPLRLEVGMALAASGRCGAVIDVSDGLAGDLAQVCRASRVSAVVDPAALPLSAALRRAARRPRGRGRPAPSIALRRSAETYALGGGEDYELLFTCRADAAAEMKASCADSGCVISRLGEIVAAGGAPSITDPEGRELGDLGHSHFRRRP